MGRGIGAVILMEFYTDSKNSLPDGFLDFYSCEKRDREYLFKIKDDLLLANYGDFLCEFYQIIGEDLFEQTKIHPKDNPLKLKDMNSFTEELNHSNRNALATFITSNFDISILSCASKMSWLFYCGNYKAYLEEYSTLTHFERILANATKNSLSQTVKFCEYG